MTEERSFPSLLALVKYTYVNPANSVKAVISTKWDCLTIFKLLAFILAETFVIAACLQYWWFGQLYIRSTIYLWAILMVMALVPTLGYTIKMSLGTWAHSALLLLVPSIISCILMILFRLGVVDYIDRYLYRSPLLVSLALIFMLSTLLFKILYRKQYLKGQERNKRVLLMIMGVFVDLALMVGFVLFLLNYEGIISVLP